MDLVVDANALFSAAIKDSATVGLLLRDDLHLHAPEYRFDEFDEVERLELDEGSVDRPRSATWFGS